jgi:aminopeptidase
MIYNDSMTDPRISQLAASLIRYSIKLQPGEHLLIDNIGNELPLCRALVREAYAAGGLPFVNITNNQLQASLLASCTVEQLKLQSQWELDRMKSMHAYIGIRASDNVSELSGVDSEHMARYQQLLWTPVHSEQRVKHTKWCILRYPNPSMAQLANMGTEAFEDFYFNVCNLDYSRMSRAMDRLVTAMERSDKVRIVAPGTDLSFSIKGIPAIKCDGRINIPDGEVYTAPVRDSVNGVITYNCPAVYQGVTFENIRFEFKDGKIIGATANNTARLNAILDTDVGARYVGEFAIGFNPYIDFPMKDTLFDEKIRGSLHFTPGRCYDQASNGNQSAIHWDLVLIQRADYGGGEIWFDNELIRKDGFFIPGELQCLNPENLV